jgi:hypothetical protein
LILRLKVEFKNGTKKRLSPKRSSPKKALPEFQRTLDLRALPTLQKKLVIVEIKGSEHLKDSFFDEIRAFQEEKFPADYYLISRCKAESIRENIYCVHYESFLKKLWAGEIF